MTTALLIVDVQNDFTEGGALACEGGSAIAREISRYVGEHRGRYSVVVASRDWHNPDGDNGGHFAETPDWVDSWPIHCVAGTAGANYHANLDASLIDEHVAKGQGSPAYSAFEGIAASGRTIAQIFAEHDVHAVDVVGIATDYCVRASALDAVAAGLDVAVLANLCVGVSPAGTVAALSELSKAGVHISVSASSTVAGGHPTG